MNSQTLPRAVAALAPLVVVLACSGQDGAPSDQIGFPVEDTASSPAGDTVGDEPATADSVPAGPVAAFLARQPPEIFVREGACPFECCTYRTWQAEEAIPVLEAAETSAPTVATIAAGADFEALGGEVRVEPGHIVVLTDTLRAFAPRGRDTLLTAGDTLVPLDNVGEGYVNAWVDGAVWQVPMVWAADIGRPPPARAIGTWQTRWWVRVRSDGTEGWILADSARFANADRCG